MLELSNRRELDENAAAEHTSGGSALIDAPAQLLAGLKLEGGWTVVRQIVRSGTHTGGRFSCSYEVKNDDGRAAFLKALDYSIALSSPDPPSALNSLTTAFLFEREILEFCANRRMDRVIRAIGFGNVCVDKTSLIGRVDYLIFEMAESDLRNFLSKAGRIDAAWKLRALHHIATGLNQLHLAEIAHQDTKPSNIAIFSDCSKISDLGHASRKGMISPRDKNHFADPSYAPPELRYSHLDPDWSRRRLGCDLYHLGSMIVFLFAGVSALTLTLSHLDAPHLPENWNGTYLDLLPYVRNAWGAALREFSSHVDDAFLRGELTSLVSYLCDPDPSLRGHPSNRVGHAPRLSLERFVSRLDFLASKAERGLQ
jgi:eukaryotic-like serine/threonine-protein kinase